MIRMTAMYWHHKNEGAKQSEVAVSETCRARKEFQKSILRATIHKACQPTVEMKRGSVDAASRFALRQHTMRETRLREKRGRKSEILISSTTFKAHNLLTHFATKAHAIIPTTAVDALRNQEDWMQDIKHAMLEISYRLELAQWKPILMCKTL